MGTEAVIEDEIIRSVNVVGCRDNMYIGVLLSFLARDRRLIWIWGWAYCFGHSRKGVAEVRFKYPDTHTGTAYPKREVRAMELQGIPATVGVDGRIYLAKTVMKAVGLDAPAPGSG